MKKLMIAAAVICSAVAVQAAQVTWSSSAVVKSLTDAQFAAGLVDGKSYDATGLLVTSAGYKSYASGTLSYVLTLTYDLGSGVTTETFDGTLKAGAGLATSGKINQKITSDLFSDATRGTEFDYTILLTDTGTDGEDQAFTLTASYSGSGKVTPTGTIKFESAAPTAWTASVTVPEPTTGLLMLLGMAGLALRRRRA